MVKKGCTNVLELSLKGGTLLVRDTACKSLSYLKLMWVFWLVLLFFPFPQTEGNVMKSNGMDGRKQLVINY